MTRRLLFAVVILCFAVLHAIALNKLDGSSPQDGFRAFVGMSVGD
jgi:hypothetical protein